MQKIMQYFVFLISLLVFSLIFLGVSIPSFAQEQPEQLTITTYYPSPGGNFNELRTNSLAVGSAYRTSRLSDGLLIVSGSVGIGTPTPDVSAALDVSGRVMAHDSGVGADMGYNGSFVSVRPPASGQHINLIRSRTHVWSIGMVYNTNNFAIGTGQDADASFTNPQFVMTRDGNVGIGKPAPGNKLEVNAVNNSVGIGGTLVANQSTGLQFLDYGTRHAGLRWTDQGNSLVLEDASNSANPNTWYNSNNVLNFQVRRGSIFWGDSTRSRGELHTDQGSSIELGGIRSDGNSATPYIDFHNNMSGDYHGRIILQRFDGPPYPAPEPRVRMQLVAPMVEVVPPAGQTASAFRLPRSENNPFPCNADHAGAMYFDTMEFTAPNLVNRYGALCLCTANLWGVNWFWEKIDHPNQTCN